MERGFNSYMVSAEVPRIFPIIEKYRDVVAKQLATAQKSFDDATGDEKTEEMAKLIKDLTFRHIALKLNRCGLEKNGRRQAIVQDLMHILRDEQFEAKLNTNKDVLNIRNGVVELKTETLRQRVREDFMTFTLKHDYVANHPGLVPIVQFFKDFTLAERLQRNDLYEFLHRCIGYSITGHNVEEILLFFLGKSGGNGKGVVMQLFDEGLGEDLYYQAPMTLVARAPDATAGGTSSHLMAMEGKRVAYIDELPSDAVIDDFLFKTLTGGGKVSGRRLQEEQTSFRNITQLCINSNDMPECRVDDAILRRFIGIPCDAEARFDDPNCDKPFDKDNKCHFKRDPNLKANLDPAAFMVWAVQGARLWYEGGLGTVPACCKSVLKQLVTDNDKLGS
jgi:P4 family phage/plasmid primase-like protien